MNQSQTTVDQAMQLAMQQHQAGNIVQAEAIYQRILGAAPNHAEAMHLLGVAAHQLGRSDEGIELIRRAIKTNPAATHYLCNLGQILTGCGRFEEAVASLQSAVALDPALTDAHYNLGHVLYQLKRLDEAEAELRRAIAQRPIFPNAWNTLGAVLRSAGKADEAITAFEKAIAQRPDFSDAYYNLGQALRQSKKLDEALAAFRKSIELNSNQADAHNSIGVVLFSKHSIDEALVEFQRSVELKPDFPEALNNVGLALQAKGQYERAGDFYRSAIAARPTYAAAHHNLSTILLTQGDFQRGWEESEWRWKVQELGLIDHKFPKPVWDGSELKGKCILLYADQSFGDTIQFARYAPLVARRGGMVTLAVEAPLRKLMQSLSGVEMVMTLNDNPADYDTHCALASLPLKFKTTIETIPNTMPYLSAEPGKIRHWRRRLETLAGLKVGLAWAGRPDHGNDHNRSMPLSALRPLLQTPGIAWISLQKGPAARQIENLAAPLAIHDFTTELEDFSDTAALIECLDLVIGVDTSVAHLAGAMNRPIWVLVPFVPDWRWMTDRNDSPWYPTMRLFRQTVAGDWSKPLADVAAALQSFKIAP